jgi:hypothetical protein
LRKALKTRGYKKNEIQGEKDRVLLDSKQEVLRVQDLDQVSFEYTGDEKQEHRESRRED